MDICSSPKLFAAYHVFHRLLVPRHPPCALSSLTRCFIPRERDSTKKHSVASLVVCLLYLILSVCLRIFRYASDVLYLKYLRFNLFQYAVFKVRLPFRFRKTNAEGGIWTLAPLLTTYSLSRGAPSTTWVLLQVCLNSQITGKPASICKLFRVVFILNLAPTYLPISSPI